MTSTPCHKDRRRPPPPVEHAHEIIPQPRRTRAPCRTDATATSQAAGAPVHPSPPAGRGAGQAGGARAGGELAQALEIVYRQFVCLEVVGQARSFLAPLEAAAAEARAAGLAGPLAYFLVGMGRIRYIEGEYRQAALLWTQCLDLCRLSPNEEAGIEARVGLGQVYDAMGDGRTAARLHGDASVLAGAVGDPYLIAKVAINQGFNLKMIGQAEGARAQFSLALEHARLGRVRHYEAEIYWYLSELALAAGALEEAQHYVVLARDLGARCGHAWLLAGATRTLATIYQQRGEVDAAAATYGAALELAGRNGARRQQAECHEALAQLAEAKGDFALALRHARQSQALQAHLIRQLVVAERLDELRPYDLSNQPPLDALLALSSDPALQRDDPEAALAHICQSGLQILDAERLAIWRKGTAGWSQCAGADPAAAAAPARAAAAAQDAGYWHSVEALQETRVAHDIRLHPHAAALHALYGGAALHSLLEIPLRQRGQCVGLLHVARHTEGRPWSRDEVLFGSHLGVLAEQVLANAQIHGMLAELQEMNEQLEARVASRTAELQAANQALEEVSLTDALTGLRNRRYFLSHVERDVAHSLRLGAEQVLPMVFYLIDIDHFKQVNDRHGHAAGDLVLRSVSQQLRLCARESDYLVRWGGEEFLVVSRGVPRAQAGVQAERIRATIAATPIALDGGATLRLTCSLGFASFPSAPSQHKEQWPAILEIADQALYLAKRGGRDAWVGIIDAPPAATGEVDVTGWIAAGAATVVSNRPAIVAGAAPAPDGAGDGLPGR
ncbi:sensor domain-containing diguanylate cyclase [Rugamonas apoptosis]|uniref:diguanylate cyclase n=1 Tax=Rugamonas apoptosis TaxID=2758570 RepID=A0A7W2INC5_9BURK|nr:sensor domain-containing diguanylate cyclase [Rugamonas apoptosis]MBA5690466.1 diguanylate cyclase [Rugamonas apoptosis]